MPIIRNFIETMRTKGIKTAIDEAKAQEHLQKNFSETGSKYQEAGSSVAGFATKALGAVGIVMSIGTIFAESVSVLKKLKRWTSWVNKSALRLQTLMRFLVRSLS